MQCKQLRARRGDPSRPLRNDEALASNEKNLVHPRKTQTESELKWSEGRCGCRLTGGAENLKSEDPLRARNFGEYIRS